MVSSVVIRLTALHPLVERRAGWPPVSGRLQSGHGKTNRPRRICSRWHGGKAGGRDAGLHQPADRQRSIPGHHNRRPELRQAGRRGEVCESPEKLKGLTSCIRLDTMVRQEDKPWRSLASGSFGVTPVMCGMERAVAFHCAESGAARNVMCGCCSVVFTETMWLSGKATTPLWTRQSWQRPN